MSTYRKIGVGGAALVSIACNEPPLDATDLTSEELSKITKEMERFDEWTPVIEDLWEVSSIRTNLEGEDSSLEESKEMIHGASEHFIAMLNEGRVLATDQLIGKDGMGTGLASDRSSEDNMKDWIVLSRQQNWGPWIYLHEAVHSLDTNIYPADYVGGHSQEFHDASGEEERMRVAMEFGDSPYILSEFVGAFEKHIVPALYSERALSDPSYQYEQMQHADPDNFAKYLYWYVGDIPAFEASGVTHEELLSVYARNADLLKELQRNYVEGLREGDEARSEVSGRIPSRVIR